MEREIKRERLRRFRAVLVTAVILALIGAGILQRMTGGDPEASAHTHTETPAGVVCC